MSQTDWCCAGCRRPWVHYPAIKIPTGDVDSTNYPVLAVEYNRYCYNCAVAILTPPQPKKRWWQFWRWLESQTRTDFHRFTNRLNYLIEEDLEQIYGHLPGREGA